MTTVITACTKDREAYIQNLHRSLLEHAPHVDHLVVVVGDEDWLPWDGAWVVRIPQEGSFNLAKSRNVGFRAASFFDDKLIWLDADCVVGPETISNYESALEEDGVFAGSATWLKQRPEEIGSFSFTEEEEPERKFPGPGLWEKIPSRQSWMVFGLSFGMNAATWAQAVRSFGGFDEEFSGWGPEDTDFAVSADKNGIPLYLLGGAPVFHQHHESEWPPVSKADDVVRNTNFFRQKHGFASEVVLGAFEKLGLLVFDKDRMGHLIQEEVERFKEKSDEEKQALIQSLDRPLYL